MNLIKLGTHYINLDNVTTIEPHTRHDGDIVLAIHFTNAGGEEQQGVWIKDPDEQAALRWYLANIAVDVRYERAIR